MPSPTFAPAIRERLPWDALNVLYRRGASVGSAYFATSSAMMRLAALFIASFWSCTSRAVSTVWASVFRFPASRCL